MEYRIGIDEERIARLVEERLVQELTEAVKASWGVGYAFRKDCKEVMREVIRANIDDFASRAIAAAAKSIENRAVRQKLNDIFKEASDG